SSTMKRADVAQSVSIAASVAQVTKATAAAKAKDACLSTLEAKKAQYAMFMKERKFWDASLSLRSCADVLAQPDLVKLVGEAEIASHMADINNLRSPPRERARAMYMLARDYPEVGAKYAAQADKLVAEADRRDQAEERKQKRSKGVTIGMPKEDVLASSWGRPESVNTTTTSRGTREQWVYGGRNYLYFENGVLTTIQN
ncbi:MAG: DUF2845 domain-containing protein, partial [Burkholderiales bacterium]|nr:DUF2845 domain-containing protein [Burkholderiales bacterium]